jgi:hypothetical protein
MKRYAVLRGPLLGFRVVVSVQQATPDTGTHTGESR